MSRPSKKEVLSLDVAIPDPSATAVGSSRIQPSEYDVKCLKDKSPANHKGNQLFRDKIESYAGDYAQANKRTRTELTKRIVNEMQREHQSRFLKYNSNQEEWVMMTVLEARDKTSHALRYFLEHGGNSNPGKTETKVNTKNKRDSVKSKNRDKKKPRITSDTCTTTESSMARMGYVSSAEDDYDNQSSESSMVNIFQLQRNILERMNRQIMNEGAPKNRDEYIDRSINFVNLTAPVAAASIQSNIRPPQDLLSVSTTCNSIKATDTLAKTMSNDESDTKAPESFDSRFESQNGGDLLDELILMSISYWEDEMFAEFLALFSIDELSRDNIKVDPDE